MINQLKRPYEKTKTKGMYQVKDSGKLKYPVGALRPTKNAAGMAYTAARSGHGGQVIKDWGNLTEKEKHKIDVTSLNVRGTLDTLARKSYLTVKMPCESCGCKCNGKLRLKKNA